MALKGYFVIADITGYTAFLTGSELDHAQDILKTLFNTLLDNMKLPLVISNFQGDANLTYAQEGTFAQGQTLLEGIENIYSGFAHTRELMVTNTSCTCNACSNIPKLDLKVFIHYGEYVLQDMRGKMELSGPDVIIVHRMMKNNVREATGLHAYALFSKAAIEALGLEDFSYEMKPHQETYEHIGEVPMYAYCLKTMWEGEREKRRIKIPKEGIAFSVSMEVDVPPALMWEYLHTPEVLRQAMSVQGISLRDKKSGRQAVGSTMHCAHGGDAVTLFTILDWHPFEYKTERISGFLPGGGFAILTTHVEPAGDSGSRVTWAGGKIEAPGKVMNAIMQLMTPISGRLFAYFYRKDVVRWKKVLAERSAASQTT